MISKNYDPATQALLQSIATYIEQNSAECVAHKCLIPVMEESCIEKPKALRRECAMLRHPSPKASSLEEMLKQEDAGFSETLLKLIDETGQRDSVIYKKANLSKQHFSKIRNNPYYKPTKPTAIALAVALELNLEQTRDLIGRAGYALTNSSKFDLIIRYFIEQKIYDIVQINIALYEFDQVLLGS